MNPFSIVLKRLWEILEANPMIAESIRSGNRIQFVDELGLKENIGHGDLPEIVLVPDTFTQNSMGTSGTGELTANFQFYIATGKKNVEPILTLQWELFRALNTFMAEMGSFEYHGNSFVTLIKMTSGAQSLTENGRNRNITGWSASWGFSVDMMFPNADLIYEVEGT